MKPSIAALALLLSACASSDPAGDRPVWTEMTAGEAQAAMLAAAEVGPEHAAKAVGSYQVLLRAWWGPDEPPVEARGTAHVESILGGRYLRQTLTSDMAGMPFTGELLMGFDNVTQRMWSLWIDDLSTGYLLMTGHEVRENLTELEGTVHDAATPAGRRTRATIEVGADGTSTWRMYDSLPDGAEFLTMELVYTRA